MTATEVLGLSTALLNGACPAMCQTTGSSLQGQLGHPATPTLANLRHLPAITITVTSMTGHGAQSATHTCTPGWKTHLQHTIMVGGRDGYEVALSNAELDPGFAGKQMIMAYQQDGKLLEKLQLVVPGDRKAGREGPDLVTIEVR